MADLSQAGGLSEYGSLTGNTLTTIFTSQGQTRVRTLQFGENTGAATPALTIGIYNESGTLVYTKRKAVAFATAGTELTYDVPFYLNPQWSVRLTSGDAAGKIDWCITYDAPAAAGRLR